ncbi:MAG: hypothetical protein E7171_04635 [Firmicutes bacterium]|nr:hypothetical protein [Bacillota bacterium]
MNLDTTALITLGISLIMCFLGFKVQKLVITLAWFVIGYRLGGVVGGNFLDGNTLLITQIVVGIILGSLGYKLEKLALAIAVAYLTYISIGPYITGFEEGIRLIIHIGGSLLAGILATFFIRPILIGITAIAGATLIRENLPIVIPSITSQIALITAIVIAVLGLLTQFKTTR